MSKRENQGVRKQFSEFNRGGWLLKRKAIADPDLERGAGFKKTKYVFDGVEVTRRRPGTFAKERRKERAERG